MKSSTTTLATQTNTIGFTQLRGIMLDLSGEYGKLATAKDLFQLAKGQSSSLVYEKIVYMITGESPIVAFSITKIGPVYNLQAVKDNKVEYASMSCSRLIEMVAAFEPSAESKTIEGILRDNKISLLNAIERSVEDHGRKAVVSSVLKYLQPNMKLGTGRYVCHIQGYQVIFNGFLSCVIVEVIDHNGFKKTVTNARQLQEIIR